MRVMQEIFKKNVDLWLQNVLPRGELLLCNNKMKEKNQSPEKSRICNKTNISITSLPKPKNITSVRFYRKLDLV